MSCPLCDYPYRCPCDSCMEQSTSTLTPWIIIEDNLQACPCCGLTLSLDEWADLDWQHAKTQWRLSDQSGGCLSGIDPTRYIKT